MRDYHQCRSAVAAAMPGTRKSIMEATGFARGTVEFWIRDLRKSGESHIASWQRPLTTGPFVPVHVLGVGKDQPCRLKPATSAEHWRRAKARRKLAEIDIKTFRQRASYWRMKALKQKHTWFSPLMEAA